MGVDSTMASGKLNFALSGVALLTFVIIHVCTFRLGETQQYMLRPPPNVINVDGIIYLNPFWTWDSDVAPVAVRNIYKQAFDVFENSGWVLLYIGGVCVLATHMCLGWQKLVAEPHLEIPVRHQAKAAHVGYAMTAFIALLYATIPIYCYMASPSGGCLGNQFEGPSSLPARGVMDDGHYTEFGASGACIGF